MSASNLGRVAQQNITVYDMRFRITGACSAISAGL